MEVLEIKNLLTAKQLREDHFIDIAIMPCYVKDKGKNTRIYSYAITVMESDGYRAVPNPHKPFPKIATYELALEDATKVASDYYFNTKSKNLQDGK